MITVMFVLYEFLIFSIKWATINDILDIVEWQELLLLFFFPSVCWGPPDAPEGLPPNVDSIAMALLPFSHYQQTE